jgi:hypothetical protein
MGVFDNVSNDEPNAAAHPDIALLETQIGRREAIDMHYVAWKNLASVNPLAANNVGSCPIGSCIDLYNDKMQGRIPLIAWNCGDTDANVAAGVDDPIIEASAAAMKAYKNPIMLRWFWEMNLDNTDQNRTGSGQNCYNGSYDGANGSTGRPDYFDGVTYVKAWRHIWSVFHNLGVTNVIWVWNPGDSNIQDAPLYWPGSQYVDWIGGDVYDRSDLGLAAELDNAPVPVPLPPSPLPHVTPYSLYGILTNLDPSKPLIIAENGAHTDWATSGLGSTNQERYFGASTYGADYVLKQHSRIHAYDYFDADETIVNGITVAPPPEVADDWDLTNTGIAAYKAFVNGPYESLTAVP